MHAALAVVLASAGDDERAQEQLAQAVTLYERKGNRAAVTLLRRAKSPMRGSSLDTSTL
jgi:hypothetical protein